MKRLPPGRTTRPRRRGVPDVKMLSVREAAEALGVSETTVRALCSAGRLAHHRVGARGRGKIVIGAADVESFLAGCRVAPPSRPPVSPPPPAKPARAGRDGGFADYYRQVMDEVRRKRR